MYLLDVLYYIYISQAKKTAESKETLSNKM